MDSNFRQKFCLQLSFTSISFNYLYLNALMFIYRAENLLILFQSGNIDKKLQMNKYLIIWYNVIIFNSLDFRLIKILDTLKM